MMSLPRGKLSPELLSEFLSYLPSSDLILPPGVGIDATGLAWSSPFLSMTMDPITLASQDLARHCVAVNINDLVCAACRPRYFSSTLLLPLGTTKKELLDIGLSLGQVLREYGLKAATGHTEVTSAVKAPVMVGHLLGEPLRSTFLDPREIRAGDAILLYQAAGIEGSIILGAHYGDLPAAAALMQNPGICLWPGITPILLHPGVIAVHDPTEGGVATALHELADTADLGFQVEKTAIPILPVTQFLCDIYQLDPLGLLASGSALVICRAETSERLLQAHPGVLHYLGEMTSKKKRNLPRFNQDEILKIQEGA